ncbi:rRNA maturation RNase YbeY [Moraxella oblonga]|uniref:rRNA maturation RNase YbeY n=1 Tax=Moraxella oblonga TaxID=200413 RepID=UPI000A015D9A|nr:rRNA maturation RNase YbeY [Moraxella oblonga]
MNEITISFADDVAELESLPIYQNHTLTATFNHTLDFMGDKIKSGLFLPYFIFEETFAGEDWIALPKSLDIYVCGMDEGKALNLDARGKDYATNILSYPSDIPNDVCQMMNNIPLGELIICHDVLVREADEQDKTLNDHFTHLLVHGVLHLLGFDHELGEDEAFEMEQLEIEILSKLGIENPYRDDEY